MSGYVIGLDCSTTAVKAVAFTAEGEALAEGRAPLTRAAPHPGWAEQHAESWWDAARIALRRLTGRLAAAGAGAPAGLAITHQRETFVCLDSTGREVRPAILWLDTRAGDQIARYGSPSIHSISGKPPSTTPSLYKLLWLRENEPEALRRTAMLADVHAYLVLRLTDRFATSLASADPTSLVDMRSSTWSKELIELVGLSADALPALVLPGEVVSTVSATAAEQTGLPAGLPVVAGGGDGQVAGLGAGVVEPGEAYLSLGTSLTIGVQAPTYGVSAGYRTLASPLAGCYTLEALVASGALSLAWFREQILRLPDSPEGTSAMTDLAATSPPGSRGLLFLPYLTSAETPYWDSAARGAFVGLGEYHGAADLAHAVFEGLALESRLQVEGIEKDRDVRLSSLVAMGGGARSPLLLRTLADALGRDIAVAADVETAALGAAMLAAFGVRLDGASDLTQVAHRMSRRSEVVHPDGAFVPRYDELFAVYRSLYPTLREAFRSLARFR